MQSVEDLAAYALELALEKSPAFPEQLIVSLVNSSYLYQPALRKELIEEVNRKIEGLSVLEDHTISMTPLAWTNELEGYELQQQILSDLQNSAAWSSDSEASEFNAYVLPFFSSLKRIQFVPNATLPTSKYSSGHAHLPPRVCREILGLNEEEIECLVSFLNQLGERKQRNPRNRVIVFDPDLKKRKTREGGVTEGDILESNDTEHATSHHVTVAVSPFADALFLPTLLYSVSDLVNPEFVELKFLPSSFFDTPEEEPGRPVLNTNSPGNFDFGYTIKSQKTNFNRQLYTVVEQFGEGITRSIFSLINNAASPAPSFRIDNISLLGDFAPPEIQNAGINQTLSSINSSASQIGFNASSGFKFISPQTLTKHTNLASNELKLLNLIGSLNVSPRHSEFSKLEQIIGFTVSTDAHIGCILNGLASAPLANKHELKSLGTYSESLEFDRRFSCLAWGGDQEKDGLCWYFYTNENQPIAVDREFEKTVENLETRFRARVGNLLRIENYKTNIHDAHRIASRETQTLASALLSPVFISNPNYDGTLIQIPAFDWMHKITSENAHLEYMPYWVRAVKQTEPKRSTIRKLFGNVG